MARQRKLSPERKAFINSLLEHYQPSDANDVQEMLKDLLVDTLQGMLEAEMDQKLGYSKYDYQNKQKTTVETVTVRRPSHLLLEILIWTSRETSKASLSLRL